MTRKRPIPVGPHALRASGDRWLFGYADVVTLLFACFATLYAANLAPPVTAAAVPPPAVAPATTPAPVPLPEVTPLERAVQNVLGRAADLPVEVAASNRGLVVSLPEAGSFPAGTAQLSDRARSVMHDLADELRDLPNLIRVEGHTDDVPIHTTQFGSNWELSTSRATTVVQYLIEAGGLDPARLSAAGYAEYRPRVANDTAEQRARNRRVDIVILDPAAASSEEPGR